MPRAGGGASNFPFSEFTFTSAGKTGRLGPNFDELKSSYSSQIWASNPSYFSQGRTTGYQVFTIPKSGIYEFEVAGARGQDGTSSEATHGRGAIIKARIAMIGGEKIEMVVGQVPGTGGSLSSSGAAGGGGGSFVVYQGTTNPIIVAGGGGGRYGSATTQTIRNGQTRRTPYFTAYSPASYGTNPPIGHGGSGYHAGGGGGLLSSGTGYPGYSYTTASGSTADPTNPPFYTHGSGFNGGGDLAGYYSIGGNSSGYTTVEGGFGGGGGGHSGNNAAGGGGGYSGGHGGQTSYGGSYQDGVGGGSFIISSATNISTSDGYYDGSTTFNSSTISNLNSFNQNSGYIKVTFIY